MIAEIISVGTELLMGQIVNTDAQYIAQKLSELGVYVYHQCTVGDNHDRLKETIRESLSRSDIVILTGGLGPTADDITKEVSAEIMGKTLENHEPSLAALKARFSTLHQEITPNNYKQAMFPTDAIIMDNPNGTAPGCIMEADGKAIALLPGPPWEMCPMFDKHLFPYLEARSGHKLYSRVVRIFGKGESSVEQALKDLMQGENPTIAPYAKRGEVTLRVTAFCQNEAEGEALVEPMLGQIEERIGAGLIYSTQDEELHEVCAKLLLKTHKTLALAESCTGGMLASKIVDIPGCSTFFFEGCVTYSNEAKISRLGVRPETLAAHGAVSAETAREMAEGIRRSSGADFGLATTGIAGPDGGTAQKPVGLVYMALASASGTQVRELQLSGAREHIRVLSCLHAFSLLKDSLVSQ